VPGLGGQADRHACEFNCFFSCPAGSTPPHLLQRGVYSQVAVALKGGAWRDTSMALLIKALRMSKEEVNNAKEGHDVLRSQGVDTSQLMRTSLARLSKARCSLLRAASSSQRLLRRVLHSAEGFQCFGDQRCYWKANSLEAHKRRGRSIWHSISQTWPATRGRRSRLHSLLSLWAQQLSWVPAGVTSGGGRRH
jgi:hypothetical protein